MKYVKLCLWLLLAANTCCAQIPAISLDLGAASATSRNDEIVVSTGQVTGKWKWTGKGFVTTGFKNVQTGTEWVNPQPELLADWDLRLFEGDVEIFSLTAVVSDDDHFTDEHIQVVAEMDYAVSEKYNHDSVIRLRFEIRSYPDAPGFRTQLSLKGIKGWVAPGFADSNDYRIDYLTVPMAGLTRQTVGFYNDHDGRNADDLDFVEDRILSESVSGPEVHPDASMLFLFNEEEGIGLVKESHKVVNRYGINTGYYTCSEQGIESTGWGLALANIKRDEYLPCWASWRICWAGGDDEKQLALKIFDRMRYPVKKEDRVIMTNVWGAGQGIDGAKEENIVKEIRSCADLGIDVVQIDAGWRERDKPEKGWAISEEAYPNGFGRIMKLAEENDIKLGIWNRAEHVNQYDDRLNTLCDYGFLYYKIDIGSWSTYDMLHEVTTHARGLLKHSQYKARVNWDVTHKGLRVGYLYNREYGNLFLQNRRLDKEGQKNPLSHLYVPRRILKDQWTMAPYLNLNQIMFNVHVTDLVNHEHSNAYLYGDAYSFAIVMMCTPLYFTETWRFAPEDRAPVGELIRIYKAHRDEMYKGYVFALGDRPDDTGWTGFQNYHPDGKGGYLTLFREIDNEETEKGIQLKFIRDQRLLIEDLMTGTKESVEVDDAGTVQFKMKNPASFKFYKYKVL